MSYLPPFNGGRINASIAGNTAGVKSLVSSGTMLLAGGNNITLSQAGNAITISGGAGAGFSAGISTGGNTSGTTGLATNQLVLAGGNNITLSQATGAGGNTLSIVGSQSIQTQGIQALSAGTQIGSSGTIQFVGGGGIQWGMSNSNQLTAVLGAVRVITAGGSSMSDVKTLEFDNANGITFGANTGIGIGTITASHNGITSQSVQTQNMVSIGGSTGNIIYSNANNVTFGANASTVTASASFNQSVQTQNVHNVSLSGNTAGVMAQVSSGTLVLAGGNNITLSQAGNAVTISGGAGGGLALVGAGTTYSTGSANLNASGALTIASGAGQSFNFSVPQTSSIIGTGALSISSNGNTVSMGVPIQSVQTQNVHNVSLSGNTAGVMAQVSSGTLVLAGGNNITLSQAGNAVTISGGAGGGLALVGAGTTYSTGSANLNASGALTIASGAGQSFNFSVPQTSSLSVTGGLSLSSNGSTISMGFPAPVTLSRWEYPSAGFGTIGTQANSQLSLQHVYIPFNVTGSAGKIGVSISVGTFSSATTASANYSLSMGIYTLNGSTLSLLTASSGSANNAFSWLNTASSSQYASSLNGVRQMTVPMAINITPGEYWVGALMNSASTYTNNVLSIMGNSQIGGTGVLGVIGSLTASGRDAFLGQGMYVTGALPTNIVMTAINNTSVSFAERAAFYHALYNATY